MSYSQARNDAATKMIGRNNGALLPQYGGAFSTDYNAGNDARAGASATLDGWKMVPHGSSSVPIMSTAQKRMLGAAGQNTGYVPPRDEYDTINSVTPQLQGQGLPMQGVRPRPNYKGYTDPGSGQFFMNGLAPNTGEHFNYADHPEMVAKQQQAESRRQERSGLHRQAEAMRAQQWMDPIVNSNVQSLGLQHPASQAMLGQMYQRNSQIPWVQKVLGESSGASGHQKSLEKIAQQRDIGLLGHHTQRETELLGEIGKLKQKRSTTLSNGIGWSPLQDKEIQELEDQLKMSQDEIGRISGRKSNRGLPQESATPAVPVPGGGLRPPKPKSKSLFNVYGR